MRVWMGRLTRAMFAMAGVALGGAVATVEAGDAASPPARCTRPIVMTCSSRKENDGTNGTCQADVMFVQQGQNTHIYGCELRIRPRILDRVSVDVQILEAKSFRLRGVNFTSNLQLGESQVAMTAQRPLKETKPAIVRALIRVTGITEFKK